MDRAPVVTASARPPDEPDLPLWIPTPERVSTTHLARFAMAMGFDPSDYRALHSWSVEHLDLFWRAVWQHCQIVGDPGPTALVDNGDIAAAQFFPHATLNVAENLLACLPTDRPALVAHDEAGRRISLSAEELRCAVAAAADLFVASGVAPGDRVAAVLPNVPETIIAMLAAASIGAVFATASPDFGVQAVLDRFAQIEPKVLIGCVEYRYGGKRFQVAEKLAEVAKGLPSAILRLAVGSDDELARTGFRQWNEALGEHASAALAFVRLPFDHPWYILFSSGTTGKPKCIVHRAGGVLLMHAKEHRLACDIRAGDVVMYFTTTGWMMWNWLASALATGATVVLYDGSPSFPDSHRLFSLVEREGVTLLGVGAKFIDTLATEHLDVAASHSLDSLRTVCSTGSPLSASSFRYVYRCIKTDVHLASISGGTDLCGCFLGGVPTAPVFAGELQAPGLGMDVQFVDGDDGRALGPGDGAGELICARPFPSQPLGFLGDDPFGPEGTLYRAAYYDRIPGVWAHGDFASWTVNGGAVIHGRSDATLNPGGVRIGTADIYGVVQQVDVVAESIAFAQEVDHDVRIVLAVRLVSGASLTPDLSAEIRSRIRRSLSPRHVPALVIAVDDLPRTFSGKLVELAVADAVNGRTVRNRNAIANPETIDAIACHPDLRFEPATSAPN